jgi:hypothetical protein
VEFNQKQPNKVIHYSGRVINPLDRQAVQGALVPVKTANRGSLANLSTDAWDA